VNNFSNTSPTTLPHLERTWVSIKQAMAPGELDPQGRGHIYLAVSITNCCEYRIASHSGRAQRWHEQDDPGRPDHVPFNAACHK
jgi:AhpD family alkylhydroperoxidase